MKIRDKLLLSYLFIISLFLLADIFYTYIVIDEMTNDIYMSTKIAVQDGIDENMKLAEQVLKKYGEKIVRVNAEDAAEELSELLGKKDKYDIEKIRNDKRIRKMAIKKIYTHDGSTAGYTNLNDVKGLSIIHPNKNVESRNYSQWKDDYPEMWKLVKSSFTNKKVEGYYEFIDLDNKKRKKFMVLVRVPDTPFIVASTVNIDEFFLPVVAKIKKSGAITIDRIENSALNIDKEIALKAKFFGLMAELLLILLTCALALWLSSSLTNPIRSLCEGAKKLGKGDFSVTFPEKGSREIADLARSFNELGKELSQYMENLKKEVTARQALESEIKIARVIQEALLPKQLPERAEFQLHAALHPAKEVSGDFYDFFFVRDDILAIAIGDVSGKGVPASIYMGVTRTAIRGICMKSSISPSQALKEANEFLQEYRDTCLFVTVFLGFYNVKTGHLVYANAGHDGFILLKSDGSYKLMGSFCDIVLGAIPDYDFKSGEIDLKENESVIIYTDGVTEAVSPENELYGEERLCALLSENASLPVKDIGQKIIDSLTSFQGENQFDDITYLLLRRNQQN